MEWVDWIILAILLGSVLAGMVQGFFRTVCSLAGLVLGFALASWNYARVAAVLRPVVRVEGIANAIAFLLIAVVVMVLASLVGMALSKMLHWMGLGCLDSLAGAFVGFWQGALLVTVCILVTVAFFPQTAWLTEAKFPRFFLGACHLSTHVTPDELSRRVREGLRTLQHETPRWMHESHGTS